MAGGPQKANLRLALTTPVTFAATDYVVVTKLTAPGAVAVSLPAGTNEQLALICDGTGDAQTNNITITPDGSETINSAATYVLTENAQAVLMQYSEADTNWYILGNYIASGLTRISTDTGANRVLNKDFDDETTFIVDSADTTKKINFEPGGQSGSTTTTIATSSTTNKTFTLPDSAGEIVIVNAAQTLGSKTLTSPVINTGVSGTAIDTDDTLAADSDTLLASQQAVKAYVTNSVATQTSPTITSPVINTGVSGTAIDTDDTLAADSDTLLASQQAVKAYVDNSVASQTSPTITSPVINTGVSGTAIDTDTTLAANSNTILASQKATKAYVDTTVASASSVSTIDNAAGTSGVTLGTTDESVHVFTPSANITVKLNNTYSAGRDLFIINNGSSDAIITLTANDDSTIRQIYVGTSAHVICSTSTPTTNTSWKSLGRVTSNWYSGNSAIGQTAFGTTGNEEIFIKREGDSLRVKGRFQSGTPTAVPATLDFASLTLDTAKMSTGLKAYRGTWVKVFNGAATQISSSANFSGYIFHDGSDTNSLFMGPRSGSLAFVKANGDDIVVSTDILAFEFEVPISGWGEFTG